MKKIAILGNGRAGKDTAGAFIGSCTPLRYVGSTSQVICPIIAKALGVSPEEAWNTRHQKRMYWYEFCNEYRRDDPAKLAKVCLEAGDMVVGLRDAVELKVCRDLDLFDLCIWINNPRVPADPTVTFNQYDCDVVIDNEASLAQFYGRLRKLMRFAGIPIRS